jgi:hypothetical protein
MRYQGARDESVKINIEVDDAKRHTIETYRGVEIHHH